MNGFGHWPTLQRCLNEGSLDFVDLSFAKSVLKELPGLQESHAALLAFLFALFRQGHLALDIEPKALEKALIQLGVAEAHACSELLLEGVHSFPHQGASKWIHRLGSLFYLHKNWTYESEIRYHALRLYRSSPTIPLSLENFTSSLNQAQQEAVRKGLQYSLSFLTGGPGTGKTFTASIFVKTCLQALSEEKRKTFRIILTAPTGKAVAQLEGNLRKSLGQEIPLQSGTLHAVLHLKSDDHEEEEKVPLLADLIVVDECSMIDAKVFAQLLMAIPSGTRLLLIGDKDQLPPVEAGSVFADLLDLNLFPATQLTASLRSDRQEILTLARHIREGDVESSLKLLEESKTSDICWMPLEKLKSDVLWESCKEKFPPFYQEKPNASTLLSSMNRFILLSCMRQGPLGVEAINRYFLYHSLHAVPLNTWWVVPIMITRNDYELELYNGDLGLLVRKVEQDFSLRQFTPEDEALFIGRQGGIRQVPALALTAFEYSFCLSVHKSQGSEYDEVLILMPKGSELFGREVLYTAVTRSRQTANLAADREILCRTIANSSRKISGLNRSFENL
jgi:exodeoxyribonuclease V alpha subunit